MDDHLPNHENLSPSNNLDCTLHNGYECTCLRKLNLRNGKDQQSAKIEPHEDFPLYSAIQHRTLGGNKYMYNIKII